MDRGDARAVSGRSPIALTIAGSDSGGGAGVQADLKTFAALGVYGASAITALTAQNTLGVSAIHLPPPEFVVAEIDAVLGDFRVGAIKIGMLGSAEIAEAVAGRLAMDAVRPFLVYDPVMIASSGDPLAGEGFVDAIRTNLLPLVDCLTPNLAEAAALLDRPLAASEADMIDQGRLLLGFGPRAVLMKGGHLAGEEAVDVLVSRKETHRLAAPWVDSRNLHGTGCTLSSAIAARIVLGANLLEAVQGAKTFVRTAIAAGRGVGLGIGPGPLIQGKLGYVR